MCIRDRYPVKRTVGTAAELESGSYVEQNLARFVPIVRPDTTENRVTTRPRVGVSEGEGDTGNQSVLQTLNASVTEDKFSFVATHLYMDNIEI